MDEQNTEKANNDKLAENEIAWEEKLLLEMIDIDRERMKSEMSCGNPE